MSSGCAVISTIIIVRRNDAMLLSLFRSLMADVILVNKLVDLVRLLSNS